MNTVYEDDRELDNNRLKIQGKRMIRYRNLMSAFFLNNPFKNNFKNKRKSRRKRKEYQKRVRNEKRA